MPLERALLLPYALGGAAILILIVLAWVGIRGSAHAPRPPLPGLPWFTPLALIAVAAAAALFWLNLLSYRYSIPTELVRAVAASSVALTASALVLLAVQVDALLFPLGRAAAAALWCSPPPPRGWPLALPGPVRRPAPVPGHRGIAPARRIVLIASRAGPRAVCSTESRAARDHSRQALRAGRTVRWHAAPPEGPPLDHDTHGRLPRTTGSRAYHSARGAPGVFG